MRKIAFISILSIFLTFFLPWISQYTFPYKGFFPYKGVALQYSKSFLSKAANFDGVHYLSIAEKGYSQYEQAFFPLYPLLIRLFGELFFGNLLLAGIFLSNLCFVLGTILLYKVFKKEFGERVAFWSVIFLIFFPTSFYFNVVYTESLFLFLFALGLYFLQKKKSFFAFLSFYFLGLTRVIGVLASFVILSFRKLLVFLAPFLGLLTYMFYLYKTTGDPLFFFTAQPSFGANRSTSFVLLPQVYFRYFKIFLKTPLNTAYFTAALEFISFTLVFFTFLFYFYKLIESLKKVGFSFESSLLIYSLVSFFLPTLTGTLSSIPRYSLLAFSLFVFLGKYLQEKAKIVLLFAFLFLRIILTLLFAQGYFIS